jgi:hypothetical protein
VNQNSITHSGGARYQRIYRRSYVVGVLLDRILDTSRRPLIEMNPIMATSQRNKVPARVGLELLGICSVGIDIGR